MNDYVLEPLVPETASSTTSSLYMWRGSGIVLFGGYEDGRWVLARGWLEGDCLQHIRRWSFSAPIAFSSQVRRLVMEACENPLHARGEGHRALEWAELSSSR